MSKILFVLCSVFLLSGFSVDQYQDNVVRVAESTIKFITGLEGFENRAYRDSQGNPTIGVGHKIGSHETHLIKAHLSNKQVYNLLRKDLEPCTEIIQDNVFVKLSQAQVDALHSLCINIGEARFEKSTVLRRLNTGNYQGAADAFLMWQKPAVLKDRRYKERAMFLQDI